MQRVFFRAWIAAIVTAALSLALPAWTAPPKTLPFQGHLATSTGQPLNATVNVTFSIYAQPASGTALWTETQGVAVSQGTFSVILGTTVPVDLPFDVPYYLGMAVGGDPEMTPRAALTLAPYALHTPAAQCAAGDLRECYSGTPTQVDVGVCRAGRRTCVDGAFGACTGQVLPASEACNGLDDNCDGFIDNGATCPFLNHANRTCSAGSCVIQSCESGWGNCDLNAANGCEQTLTTDTHCAGCNIACTRANAAATCSTGACQIVSCNSGFANVDGISSNGCEFDLNPGGLACGAPTFLGNVSGDTGAQVVNTSGIGERVFRVRLTEDNSNIFGVYLSATVSLTVPAGVDYDLYVYCTNCGSAESRSSTTSGNLETVNIRKNDVTGTEDGFDIYIEVRFWNGTSTSNWGLTVQGNTTVSTVTCGLP